MGQTLCAGMHLGYNKTTDNVSLVSTAESSNPDLWRVTKIGTLGGRLFTLTAIGRESEQAPLLLSYDHTLCSTGSVFLSANTTDERNVLWRWFNGRIISAGRNCTPSKSHPYLLAPAAISGKHKCEGIALLPHESQRANLTFWHTVSAPPRPVELYGKAYAAREAQYPFQDIVFDDNIIVLGASGQPDGTTVFTKTPVNNGNGSDSYIWRRSYISPPSPENHDGRHTAAINAKYIAIGAPGKVYSFSPKNFTRGAVFLYARENMTAAPIKIAPLKASRNFGYFLQMSGNTLAVTDGIKATLYIYKYNETDGSWNINFPVLLRSSVPARLRQVNFGEPIQLSGTTFIQTCIFPNQVLNANGTFPINRNKVAVFEEDAARTGNFTLTQYIDAPTAAGVSVPALGGGNLVIPKSEDITGKTEKLVMYRRSVGPEGISFWYQDQTIDFSNPWDFGPPKISETSMVFLQGGVQPFTGSTCAPESRMKYYKRNEITGMWTEQKINATFSCETALRFRPIPDGGDGGGLAIHENTVALGGEYSGGFIPLLGRFFSRSPAVVLLYDL